MIILTVVGALLANPTYTVDFKQFEPALSTTVIATGCGNDSLQKAKLSALDKVNGVWMRGESFVEGNSYSEKITQYNGGVIRKFDVIDEKNDCITIKADIIPRLQNGMHTNTSTVPTDMRRELEGRKEHFFARQKAIKEVDSRRRALKFEVENLRYENKGDMTRVTVEGNIGYQKMWLSEYQELRHLAGEFDLQDFRTPMRVNVDAMDGKNLKKNINFRFNEELNLYEVHPVNAIKIYPKASEKIRLTFMVETSKLMDVDRFVIEFL